MAVLSDGVTIGVVLLLLFGALFFYLWLRIQQVEKRNLLLENILLDLKLTTESTMGDFPEPPAPKAAVVETLDTSDDHYMSEVSAPKEEKSVVADEEDYTSMLDELHETPAVVESVMPQPRLGSSYESMTLKDLKTLAKTRKITGVGSLTRAQLIQQLKEKDDVASTLWGSTPIAEEGGSSLETAGEVSTE